MEKKDFEFGTFFTDPVFKKITAYATPYITYNDILTVQKPYITRENNATIITDRET